METLTNNTSQLAVDLDEAKNQVILNQNLILGLQDQIAQYKTILTAAQEKVKELTKTLCTQLGVTYSAPKNKGTGKKRTFTPEAIERIRVGQKNRWAAFYARNANNNTLNVPHAELPPLEEGVLSGAVVTN